MNEHERMCRASVSRFAEVMLQKLLANAYKGGWKNETPTHLLELLREEIHEMVDNPSFEEAADIANFAMMWAEVATRRASP